MTNEELALRIQNGEINLLSDLWKQVEKKIKQFVNIELISKMDRAISVGVTREDLYQEGYFALLDAIKQYKPDKGYEFVGFLRFTVKNAVARALHIRRPYERNNPIYKAISLDAPVSSDSEDTLIYFLPDSNDEYENLLEKEWIEQRKTDIRDSIAELTPIQRRIIISRYFQLLSRSETGKAEGITGREVAKIEMIALDLLREDRRIQQHREFIISKHAYRGGFRRWRDRGMSCVESAVFEITEDEEKRTSFQQWTSLRNE